MGNLLYWFLLKPISLLPFWALYALSDLIYLLAYRVIGYRKQVIADNLRRSFPEYDEAQLKLVMEGFYRHFGDLIVESIKVLSLSEAELRKRCVLRNPELTDQFHEAGRSVLIFAGHYSNWELAAIASNQQMQHQSVGAYVPFKQAELDRWLQAARSRFGLIMVPLRKLHRFMVSHQGPPIALLLAGDQSPRSMKQVYWMPFLQQDTAVMMGTEKYGRKYNYPVVFGRTKRLRRGYYEFSYELVSADPQQTQPGEITEACMKLLESDIHQGPSDWLWSHRRWKHQRPEATST